MEPQPVPAIRTDTSAHAIADLAAIGHRRMPDVEFKYGSKILCEDGRTISIGHLSLPGCYALVVIEKEDTIESYHLTAIGLERKSDPWVEL